MGQLTQNFVDLAMATCKEGRHPSLTVWEAQQLLHAWDDRERMRALAADVLKKHQTGVRYLSLGREDEVTVYLREWQLVADALATIARMGQPMTATEVLERVKGISAHVTGTRHED